eukprot:9323991-Alexandrium_andersonii.AAC.1
MVARLVARRAGGTVPPNEAPAGVASRIAQLSRLHETLAGARQQPANAAATPVTAQFAAWGNDVRMM